jgi:hypothetical protein
MFKERQRTKWWYFVTIKHLNNKGFYLASPSHSKWCFIQIPSFKLLCVSCSFTSLSFIFIFSSNLFFISPLFPQQEQIEHTRAKSKTLSSVVVHFACFLLLPIPITGYRWKNKIKNTSIDSMIQTFEHSFENNSTFFKSSEKF